MRPRSLFLFLLFLLHCLSAHLVDRCGRAAESEQHLDTWSPFENNKEKKNRKKKKTTTTTKNQQSNVMEGFWELKPESFQQTERLKVSRPIRDLRPGSFIIL